MSHCYLNSFEYDRVKESHLMKPSEWGAVAYLTFSKYGRDGVEVSQDTNADSMTGGGTGETYKTNTGITTTGNISGVYSMVGGTAELMAAYNKAYSKTGSYYGGEGGNTDETYKPERGVHFAHSVHGTSTKYVTAYNNATDVDTATNQSEFTTNGKDVSHIGDGIHEIQIWQYYGWYGDTFRFLINANTTMIRGGAYSHTGTLVGIFTMSCYGGGPRSDYGFRTVLVIQ